MKDDAMMMQANQIWSLLDDMAENHPLGYKVFVKNQMNREQYEYKPPVAKICIKAHSMVVIRSYRY